MQAPNAPRLRVGEVVAERYCLVELLGQGGQGQVYRAFDEQAGEHVAIKILSDAFAADPEWRERMFREAHALMSLEGTAAVRVLDQQWTRDGALCLVMELLRGKSFDDHLVAIESKGSRMPVAELVPIVEPVVATLEKAHAQGIIHRDVKPANVFIVDPDHGGGVKLLDFGFAKFLRLRSFTQEGVVAGSPSYLAPEAWRAKPQELDHRVDAYALGALIFRALAGAPPFSSDDIALLLELVTTAPRPSLHALRPDLPPEVDVWVRQALAVAREQRFYHIRAMWNAFRAVCG
jgi:eukaryotic-like serine/threonine-protein kinase